MNTVLANPLSNSEGTLAQHFFRSNSLSLQTGSGPYLSEIFVMIHRYYLSSDAHKTSFQWVGRADCNHLKGVRIAQRHPAYKQLIQSFSGYPALLTSYSELFLLSNVVFLVLK